MSTEDTIPQETETADNADTDALRVAKPTPTSTNDVNYVTSDVTELKIGDDIGLTNKDPTLKKLIVAAGWDVKSFEGEAPDLDLSCFVLNKDMKTRKDEDFVFYNNMQTEEGEIAHKGDSRAGAGDGDDELIEIDLQAFPFDVDSIVIVLSIHEGDIKDQDFSTVRNVFVRLINQDSNGELCKLELPDSFLNSVPISSAMKMGRIFRDGPKWRFHADTEIPKKCSLRTIAVEYDIQAM